MSCSKKGAHKLKRKKETKSDKVTEPVKSKVAEPVKSKVTEPVKSKVAEPVKSNVAEPVKSKVAEPVNSKVAEPVFSTDLLPIKKKRGRKPNPKKTTDEVKIPKKRGRKPKEIFKPSETTHINTTEEAIILHLNIKNNSTNLNVEDQFIQYNPNINIPEPFIPEDLNSAFYIKNIPKSKSFENNYIEENYHSTMNKNVYKNVYKHEDIVTPTNEDIPHNDVLTRESKSKSKNINIAIEDLHSPNIYNNDIVAKYNKKNIEFSESILSDKNKCVSIFTDFSDANKHNIWPSKTNIDCLWCCFSFDTTPYGIPIRKVKDTYQMFGNFCTAECAAAYIFEMNYLNETEKMESYSMLNGIYKSSNTNGIKFAPSKLCLKKFGGRLTIEQFRNIVSSNKKDMTLIIPPLISIIPNIEETNISNNLDNINMSNLNNSRISKTGEILRLQRNKPLPDSNNTLESCMNLKLV